MYLYEVFLIMFIEKENVKYAAKRVLCCGGVYLHHFASGRQPNEMLYVPNIGEMATSLDL